MSRDDKVGSYRIVSEDCVARGAWRDGDILCRMRLANEILGENTKYRKPRSVRGAG